MPRRKSPPRLVPGSWFRKRRRASYPFHKYTEELDKWLFDEGISYRECRARLAQLNKRRRPPAESNISSWYQLRNRERWTEKIIKKSLDANHVAEAFDANPARTYDALSRLIEMMAFDEAAKSQLDLDQLQALSRLTLQAQELALRTREVVVKERRIELLEKKAAQADQADAVANDKALSPEDRLAKIREIFGHH